MVNARWRLDGREALSIRHLSRNGKKQAPVCTLECNALCLVAGIACQEDPEQSVPISPPVWLAGLVTHSLSRTSCDGQNLPIYLRMEGAAKRRSAQGLGADDNNKAKGTITGKGRQK